MAGVYIEGKRRRAGMREAARKEISMALNIIVRNNYLPACASPYIVHSDSSRSGRIRSLRPDHVRRPHHTLQDGSFWGSMQTEHGKSSMKPLAEGKTVKTPNGILYLCAAGTMDSLDEAFLPNDQAKNHEVRLHFPARQGLRAVPSSISS